jgi:hypothetical protein
MMSARHQLGEINATRLPEKSVARMARRGGIPMKHLATNRADIVPRSEPRRGFVEIALLIRREVTRPTVQMSPAGSWS